MWTQNSVVLINVNELQICFDWSGGVAVEGAVCRNVPLNGTSKRNGTRLKEISSH